MSENKSIKFEIATPERVLLKEEIVSVSVPTASGEVTILPDHIPMVSILKPGVLEIRLLSGETSLVAVSGGFLEVLKNKIVILADTAEKAEELDEQRIIDARNKAQEMRQSEQFKDDVEFADLAVRLEKELAREHALNKWRKLKNINKNN
ncbi:MAG: ATP synthase F1 subunit epsilon [Candidatus Falkowbacteria bacterium]|nr:ATP synthase F1 subunit epsilon [Candidatus Falkowbacteria bacterium]